jgi:hypothetical protein
MNNGQLQAWAWGTRTLVSTSTPPSLNVWHHVAYSFDGATHYLYLDGAIVNTSTAAPNAHAITRAQLGSYNSGGSFSGGLDDIRIYNVALSPTRVANLAAGSASDSPAISCTVGNTVVLQSVQNGLYASARADNSNNVMAQASVNGGWETFNIVDGGSGFVALKSQMNGQYVSARTNLTNSPLQAVATSIGPWEQFKFVLQSNGSYALLSNANGKYVTAFVSHTNTPLLAIASTPGAWEYFTCH